MESAPTIADTIKFPFALATGLPESSLAITPAAPAAHHRSGYTDGFYAYLVQLQQTTGISARAVNVYYDYPG